MRAVSRDYGPPVFTNRNLGQSLGLPGALKKMRTSLRFHHNRNFRQILCPEVRGLRATKWPSLVGRQFRF